MNKHLGEEAKVFRQRDILAGAIIDNETNCWLWRGCKDRKGYGKIRVSGFTWLAHRLAYEAFKGPIPEHLELDHTCRNTSCVNPEHLEAVTHEENCRRGISKTTSGAWQRAKTHCPRGHLYSGSNLYITKDNKRVCRTCKQRGNNWR